MTEIKSQKLAPQTTMGTVTLNVRDLDHMIRYYTQALPLEVIAHDGDTAVIGRKKNPLVVLQHDPSLKYASSHQAGLFHTAILFDSQAALAAAVNTVASYAPNTFVGSSDHLVSKAFYFNDPEGNGIELYWDREPSEWSWVHGEVEMDTIFLNPNTFLQEYLTEEALQNPHIGAASIGHVHLNVGSLQQAKTFYVDYLGFDATHEKTPGALFVSAGGYHHHMAMNTWNNRWMKNTDDTTGLEAVDLMLPTQDDVGELTERMQHYGIQSADDGDAVRFLDPWNNTLKVQAAEKA